MMSHVHIIDHYVAFHVIVSCSEQITEEEKNAKIYKTNFTKHKQFEKMQTFWKNTNILKNANILKKCKCFEKQKHFEKHKHFEKCKHFEGPFPVSGSGEVSLRPKSAGTMRGQLRQSTALENPAGDFTPHTPSHI